MDQEKFTENSLLKNTQITSNFLKPVFRKFYMIHSQIPNHIHVQMKVISQAVLELKTVSLEFKIYETARSKHSTSCLLLVSELQKIHRTRLDKAKVT